MAIDIIPPGAPGGNPPPPRPARQRYADPGDLVPFSPDPPEVDADDLAKLRVEPGVEERSGFDGTPVLTPNLGVAEGGDA